MIIRAASVVVAMRLFDQHVLPGRDCLQGKRRVAGRRRGDDERVNMGQGIVEVWIRG